MRLPWFTSGHRPQSKTCHENCMWQHSPDPQTDLSPSSPRFPKHAGNTRSIKSFCIANNPMFFQTRMSTFPKRIYFRWRIWFAITVNLKNWWDPWNLSGSKTRANSRKHKWNFSVLFKAGGHKEKGSHFDGLVEASSFWKYWKISPYFETQHYLLAFAAWRHLSILLQGSISFMICHFFFTCIFVGQPMNLFNKQIYSCSTKYRRYHPKPGELILPSSGHLALFTYCCGRSTILVTLRCVKCDVHRDINDQSQLPLAGLDSQQRLDTSDGCMIGILYQHGPQPSFMTQKNHSDLELPMVNWVVHFSSLLF